MLTQDFIASLRAAFSQWRIAVLFVQANLVEARRTNKIAILTPGLSVLIQAFVLGFVYSQLLGIPLAEYIPYLSLNLSLWQAISNFIMGTANYNDTINRHLTFNGLSPYTIHLAALFETLLLLSAKLVAAMCVIIFAGQGQFLLAGLPYAMIGIVALSALMLIAGMVSAYVLDRFRLLRALMPQLLFLALLVTPVLWRKEQLVRARWLAEANPLTHVLDVVRTPLLSGTMPWLSLGFVVLLTVALAVVATQLHRSNRDLIAFRWVA